jgi:DHA2 family multidrug resistance protein
MQIRPMVGLAGVVVGVAFSELNDQVAGVALPDIAGGLGLSQDPASWLRTVYVVGIVMGMGTGASLAVVFSARRFLLFAVGLAAAASLLTISGGPLGLLYVSRWVQGLCEGFIISNLIAVALRVLDPSIRLYGLAFYAMTATLIPALSTSLAALWLDGVQDWRFVFLESLPMAALAALLIWWGMDQQPVKYDRLRTYDWPGVVLLSLGFGALTVLFVEGERFDWFDSPMICVAALISAVVIPLFVLNQITAQQPLIGVRLLKRRNIAYAAVTLITFIVISLTATEVPVSYLEAVQGYRPMQAQSVTLIVALPQIVLLPAVARLLDFRWADPRLVSAAGLLCILGACICGALMNADWTRDQFTFAQALQAVGQPLVVLPLLMMATNAITPEEGPLGSPLVNTPRAVAEAIGLGALSLVQRWGGARARFAILDVLGQNRLLLAQERVLPPQALQPQPGAQGPGSIALQALNRIVDQQVTTIVTIDTYVVMGALVVVLLIVLAVLPERTYPPRIALA